MPWQTPTQQMRETKLIKTIVFYMTPSEDNDMAVSTEGRRAGEIGKGLLGHIANCAKNNPSNN